MKKKIFYILGVVLVVAVLGGLFVFKKFTCLMNDCNKFIQAGSEYCEGHTCCVDDCFEQKSWEERYCVSHGCLKDNCSNLVLDAERKSSYCEEHRCKIGDCAEAIYLGNHCLLHNCCEPYCNQATDEYYSYCEKHKPNT